MYVCKPTGKRMDLLHERLEMARRIARELVGSLPEEEREVLERWKAADERHRAEYEAIRQRLASGKEVWEELWRADRLAERKWKGMARRRRGRVLRWVGYAAAVVLVAGAGIYLYASREVPGVVPVAPSSAIVPGSAKAILTLSGGERLQLDDTTRVTLQEAGGTIIHKEGGVMTYASTEAEPERVEYNTLATPRGGEHAIVLADGTRAWLNAESSLTYPVRFTGGERRVEMEGEVYFEVAPDEEHPFVVESGGVDIRVLGTSFNVASREEMVVTTLVEGRVALRQGEDSLVLRPNQQAIATGKGLEVREVTARNYVLWKDGFFYFEDAPLESILDAIARWYDVEVFYVNQAVKDLPFSVKCKRYERIEEVLRRIAQTDHVQFDIRDRTIQVYEKGR